MAKISQLKDRTGAPLYPYTLMKYAVRDNGANLENLILSKTNTEPYTPDIDYAPATKKYVDSKQKVQFVLSETRPKNMNIGDIWYQLPSSGPYIWSQVDGLNYTFASIDTFGITWEDVDNGGW